ncbi:hypothetical protein AYX19_21740 (plasmid) [Paenarthrobacter ureafaciens]|nr:hypothetical protein AYX19_21740 [Paenarthrobacter ureafaciens]
MLVRAETLQQIGVLVMAGVVDKRPQLVHYQPPVTTGRVLLKDEQQFSAHRLRQGPQRQLMAFQDTVGFGKPRHGERGVQTLCRPQP